MGSNNHFYIWLSVFMIWAFNTSILSIFFINEFPFLISLFIFFFSSYALVVEALEYDRS